MNLVAIAANFNLAEAQLTRARLEAAGFHPFIANENAALLAGFGTCSTAGMLRIEVPEDEAADAREFLETPTTPAE
jgi:hypothetical protein